MEEQLLELKTCIAIYQKKYTEVVNLNIGLESKLHYLTEKIRLLEEAIVERDKKLAGSNREQELTKAYDELHSKHVEILNKISSIEKQSSRLMKLDDRMHDLEGQSAHIVNVTKDLVQMKEEIKEKLVPPVPTQKPRSRSKQKKITTPKYEAPVSIVSKITETSEEATVAEDGGEF
jgi:small-conductance mechanosensitive channel